jgi:hypothetical protein
MRSAGAASRKAAAATLESTSAFATRRAPLPAAVDACGGFHVAEALGEQCDDLLVEPSTPWRTSAMVAAGFGLHSFLFIGPL